MLAGLSAGAMCWFQGGVSRSSGPPEAMRGLGLLEGSLTVHADGEPERLPVWLSAVRDGTLPGGWALDDGVGLLFRGLSLERAVSSRPGAGAQRVDAIAGELVRHRVEVELLRERPGDAAGRRRRGGAGAAPPAPDAPWDRRRPPLSTGRGTLRAAAGRAVRPRPPAAPACRCSHPRTAAAARR